MKSLFERKLVVVTGKGGVGKTTIAAALGLAGARAGRRTIVVEVGEESRLPGLFGVRPPAAGSECVLEQRLASISIDPDQALLEWLQLLGGRVPGRMLASSGTFQYFTAAAPGAKELVTMVKIWRLTGAHGTSARERSHDLVILDAPATGHALGMLGSPHTFGAIARVGPVVAQTRRVQELLEDPAQSAYLAVALGTEMAVTEALELQDGLRRHLRRDLEAVIVNQLLPQRFTTTELQRIAALAQPAPTVAGAHPEIPRAYDSAEAEKHALIEAAVRAANTVHRRARFQHNQLARLRRREFNVIGIPFVWTSELDLAAVDAISRKLERALSGAHQSEASR